MNKLVTAIKNFFVGAWTPEPTEPVRDFSRFLFQLGLVIVFIIDMALAKGSFAKLGYALMVMLCGRWASVAFVNCITALLDDLYEDLTEEEDDGFSYTCTGVIWDPPYNVNSTIVPNMVPQNGDCTIPDADFVETDPTK